MGGSARLCLTTTATPVLLKETLAQHAKPKITAPRLLERRDPPCGKLSCTMKKAARTGFVPLANKDSKIRSSPPPLANNNAISV